MKHLNVIEINENKVTKIVTFTDLEIEKAEKLFIKIATENGGNEKHMESYVEDGYYETNGDYSVSLVWS